MDNSLNKISGCIVGVTLIIIAAVVGIIFDGWVLSILWAWFVIPVFNLPALPLVYAIGVSTILGLIQFTAYNSEDKPSTEEKIGRLLYSTLGKPALYLAIGWVVHLFI